MDQISTEIATDKTREEDQRKVDVCEATRRSHTPDFDDSFLDEGDSVTLCGYGDVSFSEAYNIPAPTTGNYSLRPKRDRPPMPGRRPAALHLLPEEDASTSHISASYG